MSAGVPNPPSRKEAIEAAAQAARDTRSNDRDAILEAQRVLRHAEKVHNRAVREAQKHLRAAKSDTGPAQRELAAAHADRRSMAEARRLLDRVVGRLDVEEQVLDLTAGISAGHDGVILLTSRRLLFIAPRRTLDIPYEDIEAVRIRGRRFGTRVTIVARGANNVISGLSTARGAKIAKVLNERTDQHARR